jgi:hypothetical protein
VDNYELHMKAHTCHADCQNPICVAVRRAVAEEREACAKVCEKMKVGKSSMRMHQDYLDGVRRGISQCAFAIRERNQNGL